MRNWRGFPFTCHPALVTRHITDRQHDDAFRARENFLRLAAFFHAAFQPGHFAVIFLREPLLEFFGAGGRGGGGEAAVVEAEFHRALTDGVFHRSGRVASLNCKTICCATSRAERWSVFISTSACW